MSDFDKFFKEQLNEEQSFPRRNRNWKMVSKRLDAFDTGGQINHTHVRFWQVVSVAAAITVGVLAWKLVAVQQQNNQLQEQVAVLQENKPAATDTANGLAKAIPLNNDNLSKATAATNAPQNTLPGLAQSSKNTPQNAENQLFEKKYTPHNDNRKSTFATSNGVIPSTQKPNRNVPPAPASAQATPQVNSAVAAQLPTTPAPDITQQSPENLQKSDSAAISTVVAPQDSLQQANAIAQQTPAPSIAPSSATPDSSAGIKAPPSAKDENNNALAAAQKDTVSTTQAPPLVKPFKAYSRLRAGAQVLAGIAVPQEKGVSALTGQGIQMEWRFWQGLSLLAGADWLRFDLNTTRFIPRFHPHHPNPDPHGGPGGPFPQNELVQVESTQRQRQLSLGLRYTLPVRFWVQPSLRVAHNWVRIAPQLISFKFEEPQHGGPHGNPEPRYLVEKTETQRLDKVWRFGAGLERETERWVLSVGADYAKDFSSTDAMFDTVMFRAGLQYKIL